MKTMRLRDGDELPVVGLGTWKAAPGQVYEAVVQAVRAGYRHIDCAPVYGNEVEVGRALSDCIAEGLVDRSELWIVSKLWNNAHAPEDVAPALEKTLGDLGLEYLDLYLIHWPVALRRGVIFPESATDMLSLEDLPIADTWRALEECVDIGLCRHIGVSNFSVRKLERLNSAARIRPSVNQIELHPYLQQPDLLMFCRDNSIVLTAYSPLGSPDRSEAMKPANEPQVLEDPVILEIAAAHSASAAQVLLSWAIRRGTTVVPKSVNPARIRQNLSAADIDLSPDDMNRIAALDRHRRYVHGAFWALPNGPYTLANLWDE